MLLSPPCVPYISFFQNFLSEELKKEDNILLGEGIFDIQRINRVGEIVLSFTELQKGRPLFKEVKVIQVSQSEITDELNFARIF